MQMRVFANLENENADSQKITLINEEIQKKKQLMNPTIFSLV